jgi:hypothetical protein
VFGDTFKEYGSAPRFFFIVNMFGVGGKNKNQ